MTGLTPEMRLLLDACRTGDAASRPEPLDSNRLLALARYHRVSGLLWQARSTLPLPDEAQAPLQAASRRTLRSNMLLDAALSDVLETAQTLGVPVILLKGIHLIHTVYACSSLRPLSDMDLLVPPEDAPRLVTSLAAQGYLSPPHAGFSLREDREVRLLRGQPFTVALDLHTDLNRPTRHHGFPMGMMWKRAVPVSGVPNALGLAPADQLVFLCAHAVPHAFGQLIWLHDIAAVLRHHTEKGFGAELTAAARACRAVRAVAAGLSMAHRFLDAPLPQMGDDAGYAQKNDLERWLTEEKVYGAARYSTLNSLQWRVKLADTPADAASILRATLVRKIRASRQIR